MDMHTEHIDELIEGYVLGALEPSERKRCEQHAAVCPPCGQQVRTAEETAHMLAFAAVATPPPITCKRKLMDRIERELFLASPTPRTRTMPPIAVWAAVAAVALFLMTGGWSFNLQRQLTRTREELAITRSEQATAQAQLSALGDLLRDPEAIRTLRGQGEAVRAGAKTYMKAGDPDAMLVVWGLPDLPPGKVYQVWVARGDEQQPLDKFVYGSTTTYIHIAPPEPMDRYQEIMVTVEDAPGATRPSDQTVLAGDL